MSDFFMLACHAKPGEEYTDIKAYPRLAGIDSWMTGARFEIQPPNPIKLEWNPESNGPKKHLYDSSIPLFQKRLLTALQEAGVDNLDVYNTAIKDPKSGAVDTGYVAVNVIGTIAAADMSKSVYQAHSSPVLIDVDFDSLSLDSAKALWARVFRLAECVSGTVIHRVVKEHLESLGGFGLSFIPPSEWIG